jgi:hypothetical protein
MRKIPSKKFVIYSKIFIMDAGNFFRHQAELVLRHQMRVSNYFVNSFYSVPVHGATFAHLTASRVLAPVFDRQLEPTVGALPASLTPTPTTSRGERVALVRFLLQGLLHEIIPLVIFSQ